MNINEEKYIFLQPVLERHAKQIKEKLLEDYPDLFIGAHLELSGLLTGDKFISICISYWRDGWRDSLDIGYNFFREKGDFGVVKVFRQKKEDV